MIDILAITFLVLWLVFMVLYIDERQEEDQVDQVPKRQPATQNEARLCIVAIFKNEAVAMREWLDHYNKEGVDHFFLINNGSTDDWRKELEGFAVTVTSREKKHAQIEHYDSFLSDVKAGYDWVLVVDLDEFMYARGSTTMKQFLTSLAPDVSEVQVPWKMFGGNGHIKQPPSIIQGFTTRQPEMSEYHKSVVRTRQLDRFSVHSHVLKGGTSMVEKHQLNLNHYRIQSLEWFNTVKRGRSDSFYNSVVPQTYYETNNQNMIRMDKELAHKHYI